MFKKLFIEHPKNVNENYLEHFGVAFSFSRKLFYASIVCAIHALVPGLFVKTGSKLVTELHEMMTSKRVKTPAHTEKSTQDDCVIEYMI